MRSSALNTLAVLCTRPHPPVPMALSVSCSRNPARVKHRVPVRLAPPCAPGYPDSVILTPQYLGHGDSPAFVLVCLAYHTEHSVLRVPPRWRISFLLMLRNVRRWPCHTPRLCLSPVGSRCLLVPATGSSAAGKGRAHSSLRPCWEIFRLYPEVEFLGHVVILCVIF